MTIETQSLESLTEKLADPTSAQTPLSLQERSLLVAALGQLAADQAVIERQRRLLSLHDASGERLDALLARSLGAVGEALGRPMHTDGFDFQAAAEARGQLADAVADARSARQVVAAALAFARDMAALS